MTAQPSEPGTRTATGSPLAVATLFWVNGLAMASAAARMPEIRERVGATPTELAFALVCVGVGSLMSMPFTGRLVDRLSSGTVSLASAAVCLGGYALVPVAGSVPVLAAITLVIGFGVGVGDVSMNVQAHLVEQRRATVLMPFWHGLFSSGAVAGALAGAWAAHAGVSLSIQLPMVSAILLAAAAVGTTFFIPDRGLHPAGAPAAPAGGAMDDITAEVVDPAGWRDVLRRSPITRIELLLGIIIFATAVGEGAANDWLALVLVDDRGAPASIGALVYAGFNVTMAIGRFLGGAIIARLGRVPVLRAAGLLASGGVAALCLIPSTATALIAAGAWGLGLSVIFPSVMSAAGEIPGRGGRAIGTVSTLGYTGFLLGAPIIGLLAHLVPLDRALLAVSVLVLLVVVLAPVTRERGRWTTRTAARRTID